MKRRYHLHLPGMIYCGVLLLVALAAMNSQNNLLFWVFGIMCSAFIVSGMISGWMMLNLRLKRLDPQFGAVGEPLLVRYALTNRSRLLPAFSVHVTDLPVTVSPRLRRGASPAANRGPSHTPWQKLMQPASAWIMHAGPRETVHGEAVFWPTQRGEAGFDQVQIWTTFPFGLVRKSVTFTQPQHTLIFPQLYELRRHVLRSVAPPSALGTRITSRSGGGDDYYGLREHRPYDSVRSIAWKRSAQLDQLVSIERSRPSPPKLRIMLNLAKPTDQLRVKDGEPFSARELEERAISLAASIAHAAHHAGYEISLAALGTDVPPIALRRSYWHLRKIMAALAGINLDAPRLEVTREPVIDAERAGAVVIHPDRVEPYPGRGDALHLTARQLDSLVIRPIGWDPSSLLGPQHDRAASTTGDDAGRTSPMRAEAAA